VIFRVEWSASIFVKSIFCFNDLCASWGLVAATTNFLLNPTRNLGKNLLASSIVEMPCNRSSFTRRSCKIPFFLSTRPFAWGEFAQILYCSSNTNSIKKYHKIAWDAYSISGDRFEVDIIEYQRERIVRKGTSRSC